MHFATRGKFKSVIAAQALALIGWASFAHGDRIGGIVFGGPSRLERRPTRGKRAMLNWIHDVCRDENWNRQKLVDDAQLSEKLKRINRVSRPGSLLVIASDWRDFDEATEKQLVKLSQHNSVMLFFIWDALEKELPPPGIYPVTQGKDVMALDSRGLQRRQEYLAEFREREARMKRVATRVQSVFISIATTDDVAGKISELLR